MNKPTVITRTESGTITDVRNANENDALEYMKNAITCDNPGNMKKHLRTLMDNYFLTAEGENMEEKQEIYCTFSVLNDLLTGCELLEAITNNPTK